MARFVFSGIVLKAETKKKKKKKKKKKMRFS